MIPCKAGAGYADLRIPHDAKNARSRIVLKVSGGSVFAPKTSGARVYWRSSERLSSWIPGIGTSVGAMQDFVYSSLCLHR